MYGLIAVGLGLAAAAMFGGASVLEMRSTKQVPERAESVLAAVAFTRAV